MASSPPEVGAIATHARFSLSARHGAFTSGRVLDVRTWPDATRSIEFDFHADAGLSGSPLLNARGEVFGLAQSASMYDTGYFTATEGFATHGPLRSIASVTSRHEPAIMASYWFGMGIQQAKRGERLESLESFETAVMYDARDWRSMQLLATGWTTEGQSLSGLAWRARLTRLMPDAPEMWSAYALDLLSANRRDEALAAARRAEELCPWRAVTVLQQIRAVYEQLEDSEAWLRVNQTIDNRLPHWDPEYRDLLTRASRPKGSPRH